MKTEDRLIEEGGEFLPPEMLAPRRIRAADGSIWVEKPSENGNGWWAGNSLLYVPEHE
jgi:hypothetical protein